MQLTWLSCWTLWISLSLVFVGSRSTNLPDCFVSCTFLTISKRDCVDAFVLLFHVNVETLLTGGGSPLATKHVVRSQVTAVVCQWSSAANWWLVTFIHICGKSTQISCFCMLWKKHLVSPFQERVFTTVARLARNIWRKGFLLTFLYFKGEHFLAWMWCDDTIFVLFLKIVSSPRESVEWLTTISHWSGSE